MQQNNNQQMSDYIVLGRDDTDKSYLLLQYNLIQTSEAEVFWCHANQPMIVGEVVRGKLLPSEHQKNNLPTLLVEK